MKVTYVSIFVIVLVLLSGMPFLITGPGAINYASARYSPADTQTQANANECDTGTNCAINSPQTQGDGTANSPTNLQISKFNEEEDEGIRVGSPFGASVLVSNRIICPTGFQCPDANGFFAKLVYGRDGKSLISSTCCGTLGFATFIIDVGVFEPYSITLSNPPTPQGLVLVQSKSFECQGNISFGDRKTCNFTNEYRVAPTTS